MLDSLGGSPAWGPEILARFSLIDGLDAMDGMYERWTDWAADVSESHAAYKSLIYFRSPKPTRSWVIAFLAMLDAAALHLSLCPDHGAALDPAAAAGRVPEHAGHRRGRGPPAGTGTGRRGERPHR